LDRFYGSSTKLKIPIRTALKELPSDPDHNIKIEGGQEHPGNHGYFDGVYWREAGPEGDLGFVEGYVSCLPNGRALFPLPYERYVRLIDDWYKKNDPSERSKIADVLYRFQTNSSGAEPKTKTKGSPK
jgi:hypothetical protein